MATKPKRIGVYPGSFDPVHLGHLDIIERGAKAVDRLVIGVLNNSAKNPMFTVEERIELLKKATAHLPNVEVVSFDGLLVDFVREQNAFCVIRGLRAVTDFEYELQMAQANRSLYPGMETLLLTARAEYSFISSSVVKDVLSYGGDISHFVPAGILDTIYEMRREHHGA